MLISEMSYSEWKEYKQKHNGKTGVKVLKPAFSAIREICFPGKLQDVKAWWMPPTWEAKEPLLQGVYLIDKKEIFIRMQHEAGNNLDAFLNCLFHEMVHAFCDAEGIKDTDGKRHLKAYADACKLHGGFCLYADDTRGYNTACLTPESMARIKEKIHERE